MTILNHLANFLKAKTSKLKGSILIDFTDLKKQKAAQKDVI